MYLKKMMYKQKHTIMNDKSKKTFKIKIKHFSIN